MHLRLTPLFLAAVCLMVSPVSGIELPGMFSGHAVLQRGESVPVWGWGTPSEEVEVRFAGQIKRTTVDEEGWWRLSLSPLDATAEGWPARVRPVEDRHGDVWQGAIESHG